jgi:DtxR family transcriptional regulator, Mn-dependent transcriptional regulator
VALQVMRHHRIIETYLAEAMGVSWDEVHPEAHKLEHHISQGLQDRMAELLGNPERDPHGSAIPPKEGPFIPPEYTRLTDAKPAVPLVVREVLDEDSGHLRSMAQMGLLPDASLVIVSTSEDGPITIEVDGERHALDRDLAVDVFVEAEE